jgi:NAD(P)-dependent dehydrogenase (short-subunit alcohol dehydrogenase family)
MAIELEGRRGLAISGDVTDRASCDAAVMRVVKEFGTVDVLVNNAAFQLHVSRFEDLTEEHFDLTLKTNLYGYFHMVQACRATFAPGIGDREHRLGHGHVRQHFHRRLLDDEGRHPCLHPRARRKPDAARDPRERGGARPGLDAAESERRREEGGGVRRRARR